VKSQVIVDLVIKRYEMISITENGKRDVE